MSHIVVISDDLQRIDLLKGVLIKAQHQVSFFSDSEQVLRYLQHQEVDLLLLDREQPSSQVLALISAICECCTTPILLLTAPCAQFNVLDGLQAGADQYLEKPYSSQALLIHIESLLRRVVLEEQRLAFQNCSQQFSLKIARLCLTETEMQLMQYFSKNDGETISKATLQKEVLKKEMSVFDRNVDVHISNIRRKMGSAGLSKRHIKTVHGQGYSFSEQVA